MHPGRFPFSLAYSLERRREGKGKPLVQRNQENHDGSLLSRVWGASMRGLSPFFGSVNTKHRTGEGPFQRNDGKSLI